MTKEHTPTTDRTAELEKAFDDAQCERDFWKEKAEGLTKLLTKLIEKYDSGEVGISTPQVQFGSGAPDDPAHCWHDEWVSHARAALNAAKETG